MTHDVVVIGAGLAGLTAALRLADAGMKTVVLAKGVGSLHLGGATVDVLGYDPKPVQKPLAALPEFMERNPDHPYARVGVDVVASSISWLQERIVAPKLIGSLDRNWMLPTAVGAIRPAAVAPDSMVGGELRGGRRVLIVGFPALKDFYPSYAAANLSANDGTTARGVHIDAPLPPPLADEADVGPLGFARSFEDTAWRAAVADVVRPLIAGEEAIGFPSVLGLGEAAVVHRDLEAALGLPVFEIPTLPPSVPGIRLYRALASELKRSGGQLVVGPKVIGGVRSPGGLEAVEVELGPRTVRYASRYFVLATGGVAAGGIEMDSHGHLSEPVLGLPLAHVPSSGARFASDYLGDHAVDRAGVAVDDAGRPADTRGGVLENVFVAGATLAGARPWREKSGNGLSLATGWHVAQQILNGK